jgi:hypothetical protein
MKAHPRAIDTCPGDIKAHPVEVDAHPVAMEAHRLDAEAHPGAMEDHPGNLKIPLKTVKLHQGPCVEAFVPYLIPLTLPCQSCLYLSTDF